MLIINSMIKNDNCTSRLGWSAEQQSLLKTMKEDAGINSWRIISNELNSLFQEKSRSPKQCRERYSNYLREGVVQGNHRCWTEEEDYSLFCKYLVHGSKWVQIAKQISGRSQNSLKNRFYGALRKIIRKIDKAKKLSKCIDKKHLRQDILIKVLDSFVTSNTFSLYKKGDEDSKTHQTKNNLLIENIITLGISNENEIQTRSIIQVGNQIKKMYLETRNRPSKAQKEETKRKNTEQFFNAKEIQQGQQTSIFFKKVPQQAFFSFKLSENFSESPIKFNYKLHMLQEDELGMIKNSNDKENDLLRQWHQILQQPYPLENMQTENI